MECAACLAGISATLRVHTCITKKMQYLTKEKICEIYGDLGIQEAIITCYECKNVDVHQYCVLVYWEDAPVDWCCE
ncbi:hypothetical protein H5410_021858 [Solanum commersonii]|uniref:Uncharacterized protein n=1 Tax=Solanum commersonii TaxID=4109 RepID=A0A9J5ZCJ4_SOLCO|nr:hypothetical protein H5410_021858 [Solanum commersonii]